MHTHAPMHTDRSSVERLVARAYRKEYNKLEDGRVCWCVCVFLSLLGRCVCFVRWVMDCGVRANVLVYSFVCEIMCGVSVGVYMSAILCPVNAQNTRVRRALCYYGCFKKNTTIEVKIISEWIVVFSFISISIHVWFIYLSRRRSSTKILCSHLRFD